MTMTNRLTKKPLSKIELDRLGDFLEGLSPPAMNLEMLDGFFAALICSPDSVQPSEYFSEIFEGDPVFDSDEEADEIFELIIRHWNTIALKLFRCLKKDDVYLPILLQDANGIAHGNDWAYGFMHGVQLHPNSWLEFIKGPDFDESLFPIMILAREHDPDPAMRPPKILPKERDNLLAFMVAGLTHIYRYFAPHRQLAAPAPLRSRRSPKVGRNHPCPCGSGRKYKHCCADNSAPFH